MCVSCAVFSSGLSALPFFVSRMTDALRVHQVKNNMLAKFPEHVPASPSFFDINSPFWQEMLQAEEPRHAGKVVGQAFGWVDGYKKVNCNYEQHVGAQERLVHSCMGCAVHGSQVSDVDCVSNCLSAGLLCQ